MKTEKNKSKTIGLKVAGLISLVASMTMLSASTPIDPDKPLYSSIQPGIFSQIDFSDGNAVSFLPWFAAAEKRGNIFASKVSSLGFSDVANPIWDANSKLNERDWDKRFIVTMNPAGQAIPFLKDFLVKDFLDKDTDKKIKFIRGDQGEEDGKFRTRQDLLGDIVNANLVYVGKPNSRYTSSSYLTYANANATRPGRVFAGANDGMLHAFDALTGEETFAYIPSLFLKGGSPKIGNLVQYNHNEISVHNKYVDGPLAIGDAIVGGTKFVVDSSSKWRTMLIGGLGSGGKGLYALDVSKATAITEEDNTSVGAGSKLVWELTPASTGLENLGYTHARASIVQMNNGNWAAVIGNGYQSANGNASLLILNLSDGTVIKEIIVNDQDANGLSTPTVVDLNQDGKVDYAYAGDLNGNLWKFDLNSTATGNWKVDYNGSPLYQPINSDKDTNGTSQFVKQSITTAPSIGLHPESGYFVYFGTGRVLSESDQLDKSKHHVHGIWDNLWPKPSSPASASDDVPIRKNDLLEQVMAEYKHNDGVHFVRIATDYKPDWTKHKGWITSVEPRNIASNRRGERVLQEVSILGGRLHFVSNNPTLADNEGENWWFQVNRQNGGSVTEIVLDTNEDGTLDTSDLLVRSFTNPNDGTTTTTSDYPSAVFIGHGLAARPSFGVVNNKTVAALINRLFEPSYIDPITGEPLPGNEDFGLIGGHMDLDVSSQTYDINSGGATDDHTHKWDDKYGPVVDFLEIDGEKHRSVDDINGDPAPSLPGSDLDQLFIITISNAHLSPGGLLTINDELIPVSDYRARMKRWLAGVPRVYNDGSVEQFPIYKLGEPTLQEAANGVVKLHTFKMQFDRGVLGVGGLIGTNTGCVKQNLSTNQMEYRNGALTTQILDATHLLDFGPPGLGATVKKPYVANASGDWIPADGPSDGPSIDKLGYALPKNGIHAVGDGMLWESTLFWHWSGECYRDDLTNYAKHYADRVGETFVQAFDDDIGFDYSSTPDETEPEPDPDPDTDPGTDPGDGPVVVYPSIPPLPAEDACTGKDCHSPLQQNTPNNSDTGRLFWRELVPDS